MAESMDCRGMKCPKPVLKVAIKAKAMDSGSTLEVLADCSSFADDVKKWCADSGKVLVSVVEKESYKVAVIRM